jgi:hypothetical protein
VEIFGGILNCEFPVEIFGGIMILGLGALLLLKKFFILIEFEKVEGERREERGERDEKLVSL